MQRHAARKIATGRSAVVVQVKDLAPISPSYPVIIQRLRHTFIPLAPASYLQASADTKFNDYKPRVAFFFPGQGAQTVGMCKELVEDVPAARDLFERASDILGYDLLKVCVEGPKEKLDSTAVSQPAIYVASLAALEKLKQMEGAVSPLYLCTFKMLASLIPELYFSISYYSISQQIHNNK